MTGKTNAATGGAGLNFFVVGGTTQPEAPKENTIWVNTSEEISGWEFSAEQPEGAEGKVWIQIGAVSSAAFNAVKKNGLWVYPAACNQFINNAWQVKTAKTFDGTEWVDWVDYIYSGGVKVLPLVFSRGCNSGTQATVSELSDRLQVAFPNTGYAVGINTVNKIDCTPYHYLKVDISSLIKSGNLNYITLHVGVCSQKENSMESVSGSVSNTFVAKVDGVQGINTVDISSVNGEYYFGLFGYGFSGGKIDLLEVSAAWFER